MLKRKEKGLVNKKKPRKIISSSRYKRKKIIIILNAPFYEHTYVDLLECRYPTKN